MALNKKGDEYQTVKEGGPFVYDPSVWYQVDDVNILQEVLRNGELLIYQEFSNIRARASEGFK